MLRVVSDAGAERCERNRCAVLTKTLGVGPFHGGGGGGGGASATTQVLDAASNTVPAPHSAALLTAGDTSAAIANR